MKNMRVSAKLYTGFLIVTALALLVGAVGIFGMLRIDRAYTDMYDYNTLGIKYMGEIRENLQQQRVNMRTVVIYNTSTAPYDEAVAVQSKRVATMKELGGYYKTTITTSEAEAIFAEALRIYNAEFAPLRDSIFAHAAENDVVAAQEDLAEAAKVTDKMVALCDKSYQINVEEAARISEANTQLAQRMTLLLVGTLVVAVITALFFAYYISHIIAAPLTFVSQYISNVAATGDLGLVAENAAMSARYSGQKDEIGATIMAANSLFDLMQLQGTVLQRIADKDINHEVTLRSDKSTLDLIASDLLAQLNDVMSNIQSSASQVSAGSKQIADGAQTLAQGSTQQAGAVEQLSSSIAQVADKTKENAIRANRAAGLASSIQSSAEKGSSQMDNMMQAVKEINDASLSINKVIKVIDDIAFQTNILALNAAVEAARAGQHGKGFAVVAEEVRNLAAKSAEAAKDTGALIANSMEKAQLGAKIAEETASSLAEIVSGINESNAIVNDIARSSEEQSHAISQINTGINQVAQVVQQNSATSEESAAAAEEMSSQSAVLSQVAAQFRIRGGAPALSGGTRNALPSHKTVSMPARQTAIPNDGFGRY